jgi:hypothetical protein
MDYTEKYLKYKKKYLALKEKLRGGGPKDGRNKLTKCTDNTLIINGKDATYTETKDSYITNINNTKTSANLYFNEKNGLHKLPNTPTVVSDCEYTYNFDDDCKKKLNKLRMVQEDIENKIYFKQYCNKYKEILGTDTLPYSAFDATIQELKTRRPSSLLKPGLSESEQLELQKQLQLRLKELERQQPEQERQEQERQRQEQERQRQERQRQNLLWNSRMGNALPSKWLRKP